ncbi:hypothetical protein DL96DRAFT_1592908 [Flagelloscypha sp. PMI_526]|nr:hypothetical protein DL96DRAFT_1592908 [Flagelloscypha sp. PMI_526]
MFSTLDLDIRPGVGLGIFDLGTSFWEIIEMLRTMAHIYPQVEIKYDPDSSAITPLILHLRPHLDLLFSSKHQRLHTICVRKLRDAHPPVTLRCSNMVLCSPEQPLTRKIVTTSLGPTYPGPGDDIRYPGDTSQDPKLQVPMDGDISRAVVKVHYGVTLHLFASSQPLSFRIGHTSAQDLMLDLGQPDRVHYKDDARMAIHSNALGSEEEGDGGYFYNYFRHGIDFLISSTSHQVKKIILHTNIPGTPMFQIYKRCPWELESEPEDDEDDTPPRKPFYDRFETISHFLSPREPPPSMLLDRTDEDENLTLPSPTTRLYGYDGIVLEVTESSQVVAVMLF